MPPPQPHNTAQEVAANSRQLDQQESHTVEIKLQAGFSFLFPKALFRCTFFKKFNIVTLSFLFNKYVQLLKN